MSDVNEPEGQAPDLGALLGGAAGGGMPDLGGLMAQAQDCLLYTSPSPRDQRGSRMPSSA